MTSDVFFSSTPTPRAPFPLQSRSSCPQIHIHRSVTPRVSFPVISLTSDGWRCVRANAVNVVATWDCRAVVLDDTLKTQFTVSHETTLSALALAHRKPLLFSADVVGNLKVSDVSRQCTVLQSRPHLKAIYGLAVSPSDDHLVTASDDRLLKVWLLSDLSAVATLSGHTAWVRACVFIDDVTVASGSLDKSVRVWNLPGAECAQVLERHTDGIESLAMHPYEFLLASGSDDNSVLIWHSKTFVPLTRIVCQHLIRSLSFVGPSAATLAVGVFGTGVLGYDITTGACTATYAQLEGYVGLACDQSLSIFFGSLQDQNWPSSNHTDHSSMAPPPQRVLTTLTGATFSGTRPLLSRIMASSSLGSTSGPLPPISASLQASPPPSSASTLLQPSAPRSPTGSFEFSLENRVIALEREVHSLRSQLSLSDTRVMVLEQQLLHRQSDSQQLESLRREFGALQAVVSGLSRDSDALPREPLSAASTECGQGQPPSRGSRSSADSSRGIHLNLLLSSEDSTI
eukprot:m.135414 g.135414  ORF g.135414 m.135414 type:complete len:514 (-) comp52452_c0_seq32:52-1593(-)